MDDEAIGCGGTLLLHGQAGSELLGVFVSDCAGTVDDEKTKQYERDIRLAESKAAFEFFGMKHLGTLNHPDGNLCLNIPGIASDLAKLLTEHQPDIVFCPFPTDMHRDHQAVAQGLAGAIRDSSWKGDVWGYEVWSTLWPNAGVDISEVIDQKAESIDLYPSQMKHMPYVEAATGLNRYRGLKLGVPAAETFYVCSETEFGELADTLIGK